MILKREKDIFKTKIKIILKTGKQSVKIRLKPWFTFIEI